MDAASRYRQLQSIWSRASSFLEQKRHGVAIRLLEEGIRLAEQPEYHDPHRLYQMRRDLAGALADLGEFDKAMVLYEKIGRPEGVGHILLKLRRDKEAVHAFERAVREPSAPNYVYYWLARALSMIGRYESALDAYIQGISEAPGRRSKGELGKLDCLLALAGLERRHGIMQLRQERSELEKTYRRLYRAIIKNYGNWRSALVHLESRLQTGAILGVAESFRPQSGVVGRLELGYDESEVETILSLARSVSDKWDRLISSLELAQKGDFGTARAQILTICTEDPDSQVASYGRTFYRDLLIVEERFDEALNWHEEDRTTSSWDWNIYLNLLLLSGRKLTGRELAEQYTWLIDEATPFLAAHKDELAAFCQRQLDAFELRERADLLSWTACRYGQDHKGAWGLFCGAGPIASSIIQRSPFVKHEKSMVCFYSIDKMKDTICSVLSGAENMVRDSLGVPRIGEGWIREAEMLHLLRECLAPFPVIPQASPKWLGGLRYDAYAPGLRLAIEYQGKQHFEAVEFFQGTDGLAATQERDHKKAVLSQLNGVRLEYIRYDDDLMQRVDQIAASYLPRSIKPTP